VTRHVGIVNLFRESGMIKKYCPIIQHADVSDVAGKHVGGVLPVTLACHCDSYTAIEIRYPAHLRGKDLTEYEVRKYLRGFTRFLVEVMKYGSKGLEDFMSKSQPYVSEQAYRSW